MEELKARILEIVEDYEEGISVLDNDMAQAGIDPKSDFVNTIEQLLEERECRAREEGRREQAEFDRALYSVSFEHIKNADFEKILLESVKKAREEGRREVLENMKKMWDNDNLGDAPKYGRAGAGLMKRWIRDDINERLSKLTTK